MNTITTIPPADAGQLVRLPRTPAIMAATVLVAASDAVDGLRGSPWERTTPLTRRLELAGLSPAAGSVAA